MVTNHKTARKTLRKTVRKTRRGGASPAPLSSVNTYTSWPGGVDPTSKLYNQSSMLGGRKGLKKTLRRIIK